MHVCCAPSIPRRGALEQCTKPPTAPWAPQHKWLPTAPGVCSRFVCVFTAVCVHLNGLNAERTFRVWVIILGCMSRHLCMCDMSLCMCVLLQKQCVFVQSCTCSMSLCMFLLVYVCMHGLMVFGYVYFQMGESVTTAQTRSTRVALQVVEF